LSLSRRVCGAAGTVWGAGVVKAALPASATLTDEDRRRRDAVRTRYGLLGMHLPAVKVLRALQSPAAKTQIDFGFASATALVLFPDGCAECRNMMKTPTKFAVLNRETAIRA
jgi:hypothetical protein